MRRCPSFNILRIRLQNAYSRPQKGEFRGCCPQIGAVGSINVTPKRHFLVWKHVVWRRPRQNPSVGAGSALAEK